MSLKRCKLSRKQQIKLVEFFVLEVTARSAADLIGIQPNTAALFYRKLRQLIADQLEPDVVEVYGAGALALADSPLKALAARLEISGETLFFYTHDAKRLLAALGDYPLLRTLHRPANLEDLFLKLTGRQIREAA